MNSTRHKTRIFLSLISFVFFFSCNTTANRTKKAVQSGAQPGAETTCDPRRDLSCQSNKSQALSSFTCTPEMAVPQELVKAYIDGIDYIAGDTLSIAVKTRSSHISVTNFPSLEVETSSGKNTFSPVFKTDSAFSMYYFQIPEIKQGELCFSIKYQGATEIAQKITVRAPYNNNPTPGVFKLISNHQVNCNEGANGDPYLKIWVVDENNSPMAGVKLNINNSGFVDGGSFHGNDQGLQDAINKNQVFETGSNGVFQTTIFSPISTSASGESTEGAGNNFYSVAVNHEGKASDVGVGISTGWWQNINGLELSCGGSGNVWGHWAHTLTFQWQNTATQRCKVHSDLSALKGTVPFIFYDPQKQPCWSVL